MVVHTYFEEMLKNQNFLYVFKEMQLFSISLNTEKNQGISKIMEYISVSIMYLQDLIIWRKIKVKWLW